ncbi:MAG: serine hydrolase domain-containing protein [Polyangiaceae bacterium]
MRRPPGHLRFFALAAVAALSCASCGGSAHPASPPPAAPVHATAAPAAGAQDALTSKVDSLARALFDEEHLVGMTVSVGTTRGFTLSRGYGLADIENGVPATEDTVYRFASVSKTITAVAAMQLAESGKLDLDAPIQRYVPTFPEKQWPITTRHILSHTSGIRHYKDDEPESTVHYPSLEAGLDRFRNEPLLHQPGTKYTYSSYAFNLLGRAIEGASGTSYVAYVHDHVFTPAGMTATRDDDLRAIVPHRSEGYDRTSEGALANSVLTDTSFKIPSGGLCGPAKELVSFSLALASHRLLRAETLEKMLTLTTIGTPPVPNPDGFGLGWMLEKISGHRVAYHTGAQPGTSAIVYLLPDDGIAVALLSNFEGATLHPVARAIAQAVIDSKR